MLVEFSVTNFKSIKDRQTLSLVASKGKEVADTQILDASPSGGGSGIKLLPSVAIYGANAAGKSNLLKALEEMETIVLYSARQQHRGDLLPVMPFKLDPATRNAPSEFEAIFIAEGVRYQYGFSATPERIVDEWLLAYPKNRPQHWFNREWDEKNKKHEWSLGASLVGGKNLWQKSTRDDALFLSTAIQLNSQQLQPVFDWFQGKLHRVSASGLTPNFSASFCDTQKGQEVIMNFLRTADLSIDGVQVKKESFDREKLPKTLSKTAREEVAKALEIEDLYQIQMVRRDAEGKPIAFDIEDESDGTQKFFSFAGPWIDVLANGEVLFVDELHGSLHPKLVELLVNLFNNKKANPNNAQLIFTTHETSILKQEVLRRDQIWFCEKDKFQATRIYPLSDFRPRKGRENLEMMYLSGRYGAVPYIEKVQG
ncbi:AAA family ATPase [Candidatus Spongiihabitans sp.]|uniref:AAA family ATPase n=1 Tax=Candidatus Spongiihabitans sp. TaxID=3101308 RepID=UPI003C7A2129